MKKLSSFVAALLLFGSLIGGCGGSSSNFAAIQQAMVNCSQSTLVSLISSLYAFDAVAEFITSGGNTTPGYDVQATLSVDPLDPPNTWDFSAVFDTDNNGVKDSAIVGKATFSTDPTLGLNPGDTVAITFTLQNTPVLAGGAPIENGTVTGSADLLATIGANPDIISISGSASFTDTAGSGCSADLVFPVATPLTLDYSGSAPAQLAADVGLFEIFGLIQATLETLGYTFNGDVTLTEGSQTVNVFGDIDGVEIDVDFELLPTADVINQLGGCLFFNIEWFFYFGDTFDDIRAAIIAGSPPPGIVVTPTANPNVFNFAVDLLLYDPTNFTGGTITGTATLSFPVVTSLAGVLPSEIAFTWSVSNAAFTSGTVTNGQNTAGRPLRLQLDGVGDVLTVSGAGTVTTTTPPPLVGLALPSTCTTTFDVPETDPITADQSDGLMYVTVIIGDDVLTAVLDFNLEEATITIDGIPFPFFF